MSKDRPWGQGTPVLLRDATANDSDKSFTVPAGKVRVYTVIIGQLVATATVGNRSLNIELTDGTNKIMTFPGSGNVAASSSGMVTAGIQSAANTTIARLRLDSNAAVAIINDNPMLVPLIVPAGYVVRVWDVNAVDAAADDLTVVLHYVEYDA